MTDSQYFDLHITGLGYVNRIREVTPRKGEPFLACDIVALHGNTASPERTRFDCRVSGSEARRLVAALADELEHNQKILVGFKLGDLYPDLFVQRRGDKAGETDVSLKARLLRIGWVKIDGETVYTAPKASEAAEASTTEGSEPADQCDDAGWPSEVSLSKADPDFETKKARLKQHGYRFDSKARVWRLAA